VPEADQLRRVEPPAVCFEPLLQHASKGEIHVVAAEQDVIADRNPFQRELAGLLRHGNEREIGRAAADIADEDQVADAHLPPPPFALCRHPGVERGLRLLEQRHLIEPGGRRGTQRKLARFFVEGGGDRQQHVLLRERAGARFNARC
jgi:hypothetical protein